MGKFKTDSIETYLLDTNFIRISYDRADHLFIENICFDNRERHYFGTLALYEKIKLNWNHFNRLVFFHTCSFFKFVHCSELRNTCNQIRKLIKKSLLKESA